MTTDITINDQLHRVHYDQETGIIRVIRVIDGVVKKSETIPAMTADTFIEYCKQIKQ